MDMRAQVYRALDSEREYQKKWEDAESGGAHEIAAFILFMEDYLAEAKSLASRNAEEVVRVELLDAIRKVTALGVACMEQHGVAPR